MVGGCPAFGWVMCYVLCAIMCYVLLRAIMCYVLCVMCYGLANEIHTIPHSVLPELPMDTSSLSTLSGSQCVSGICIDYC